MSTNYDLVCFQNCTVVHVVQTKLVYEYIKQKLETVVKIDVYSYGGGEFTDIPLWCWSSP